MTRRSYKSVPHTAHTAYTARHGYATTIGRAGFIAEELVEALPMAGRLHRPQANETRLRPAAGNRCLARIVRCRRVAVVCHGGQA